MRVLLSDEQFLVLEGLRNLLEMRGIDVVGLARDGPECIQKAREQRPDIVLMDMGQPRGDGLSAIRLLKSEMPEIKVVVLSASADDQALFEAVACGASGFLMKNMHADELIEALENALHDVPPLAPGLAVRLLAEFARLEEQGLAADFEGAQTARPFPIAVGKGETRGEGARQDRMLTPRQKEVLSLLAQGFSYKEVAARVSLTPRTVKYHVGEIMRKLHLGNRAQVLAYAGSLGLGPGSGSNPEESALDKRAAAAVGQGHPRGRGQQY